MKNGLTFYLGLFGAMALSWGGVMLANYQLGALAPHFDENEGKAFPERASGIAARGQFVYADLGCASCHTQQVRRPDFGADQARGWGERQSFARDYIYQTRVQLGESRVGPDLANLATRKPPYDGEDLMKLLYAGSSLHPAYKFLFDERAVVGQRSAVALNLGSKFTVPAGHEIVPTERAQALVAYLLSLNNSYEYPAETVSNTVKAPLKEGEHAGPPAKEVVPGKATPAKEANQK